MYWFGLTAEKVGLKDLEESLPVQTSSNFKKSLSGKTWPEFEEESLSPLSFAGTSSELSINRIGRAMTRARPEPTRPAK